MLPVVSEYDEFDPSEIDISVAHPARMYDYYLGGKTHFAADRAAADRVLAILPEGRDMAVRPAARAAGPAAVTTSTGDSGIADAADGG